MYFIVATDLLLWQVSAAMSGGSGQQFTQARFSTVCHQRTANRRTSKTFQGTLVVYAFYLFVNFLFPDLGIFDCIKLTILNYIILWIGGSVDSTIDLKSVVVVMFVCLGAATKMYNHRSSSECITTFF